MNLNLNFDNCAEDDFLNTMAMLYDGNGAGTWKEAENCGKKQLKSYCNLFKRYFPTVKKDRLKLHLEFLFLNYSLQDLKAVVYSIKDNSPKKHQPNRDMATIRVKTCHKEILEFISTYFYLVFKTKTWYSRRKSKNEIL